MNYNWNTTTPAFNWSFSPQPMQITTDTDNQKYKEIAKEFLEKYTNSSLLGIYATEYCYNTDTLISFHLHQGNTNHLFELVGHTAFKNKLAEKSITLIKYHNLTHTTQPLAKNCVLITMYGKADINGTDYNMLSTFVIRMTSTSGKIINQVLEIFI